MRKFVSSMIFSLIISLFSVVVIFLLQAPLLSFVYYGFFSGSDSNIFFASIINKIVNTDKITIVIMAVQTILTFIFIFSIFVFIKNVIKIFLDEEKLIKPYYIIFFLLTTILPVVLIFVSIFFKVNMVILTLIVELVFFVLNTLLIIFSRKIFPETTTTTYRKYLFTNGASYE